MKKKIWFILAIIFFVFIAIFIRAIIKDIQYENELTIKQSELADILNVDLNGYSNYIFPSDYYSEILYLGINKDEAHSLIKGYLKSCISGRRDNFEVYYFFFDDEYKAIKFELFFNDNGELHKFIAEEPGEPTIIGTNCVNNK